MGRTFILFFVIFGQCLSVTAQQVAPKPVTLVSGQPVEREIGGGQSHNYEISLKAGQFMRIVVEQKAIDVTLVLADPDGNQMLEVNLNAAGSFESLSAEAAATGNYLLKLSAAGSARLAGSYQVRLEVKATATEHDRQRIAAERLMLDANELRKQGGKTAEQAIDKLQQALSIWRELGDSYWEATGLNGLGSTYRNLSRYEEAVQYYEQALVIFRKVKDRAGEGLALNNLGGVYYRLERNDEAIDCLEQAITIHREVKDRANEGSALNTLGIAHYGLSHYEKAIEYHEQALAISREVRDRNNEGRALNSLGIAYRHLGRYEKAVEYHEQVLAINREMNDRAGEGITLNNLSGDYSNLDQYEKAIEYMEQALVIYREMKNRDFEGTALSNLGYFYQNIGRNEKAIEYLEQSLAINRELKQRAGEGIGLHNLGEAYYSLGRYEKAVECFEQALAISRELNDQDGESYILFSVARAERARDNLSAAREYIEESLKITESLRSDLVSPESRASFLANVLSSYQLYTDILMSLHRAEPMKGFDTLAVEVSERQRARSLLDMLTESHADVRQGVDATLIERERALAKQLDEKAQELEEDAEQSPALKQEVSQLETDLERAQAAIRNANPRYTALVQPQPLKLKEIQLQLDQDTLLLEYALGEDCSYLWAITRDSLTSYELPKAEIIDESARGVVELLTARSTNKRGESAPQKQKRISEAEAKLPAAAQELSDAILAPVTVQLGNKRLVIVADGALQYIPFAMLPEPEFRVSSSESRAQHAKVQNSISKIETKNSKPLIVNHEVISLPSASVLAIQRAELAGRQIAPKMLAVIADPVFDRSDSRFTTPAIKNGDKTQPQTITDDDARSIEHLVENSGGNPGVTTLRFIIPRLPFTRQEANQLMALTPKGSSFSAIDFQASRATALDPSLSQYRYVHIATHGWLDSERPGLSALVFSMVDAQGKPQNGFLRANDIYNLKLPAELVVLSACQTGLGKEIRGEGLVGLTRGFMYAGAARVVVSLWNVNDKATSDLMTKFYEKMLKHGDRPAAALRAAQVEMWTQKQWQSPYYWAAFIMQGEWR